MDPLLTKFFPSVFGDYIKHMNGKRFDYNPEKIFSMALKKSKAVLAGRCVYAIISAKQDDVGVLDVYVNMENAVKFVTSIISYSACYNSPLDDMEYNIENNLIPNNEENSVPTLKNKMFQITNNYGLNGTMFSMYNGIYGSLNIFQEYIVLENIAIHFVRNDVDLMDIVKNIEITTYRLCYDGEKVFSFANMIDDVFETDIEFFNTNEWVFSQDFNNMRRNLASMYELAVNNIKGIKEELNDEQCEEFAIKLLYSKAICFLRFVERDYVQSLKKVCENPLEDFTLDGLLENIDIIFNDDQISLNEAELVVKLCRQTLFGYNNQTEKFDQYYYVENFPYSVAQKNIDDTKYLAQCIIEKVTEIQEKLGTYENPDKLKVENYLESHYSLNQNRLNSELVGEVKYVKMDNMCGNTRLNILNTVDAIDTAIDLEMITPELLGHDYTNLQEKYNQASKFYRKMHTCFPDVNEVLFINTDIFDENEIQLLYNSELYEKCLPLMQNALDGLLMISFLCEEFDEVSKNVSKMYAKIIDRISMKPTIKNIHSLSITDMEVITINCDTHNEVRVCFDPITVDEDIQIETYLQNYVMFLFKREDETFESTCYSRRLLKKYYYDMFNWYYVCNPDYKSHPSEERCFKELYVKISGVIKGRNAYVSVKQLITLLSNDTRGKVFFLKPADVFHIDHKDVKGMSWQLMHLKNKDAVSAKHCEPQDSIEVYDILYCDRGSVKVKFPSKKLWTALDDFLRKNPEERVTEVIELGDDETHEFDIYDYEDEVYDEVLHGDEEIKKLKVDRKIFK